MPSAKVPQPVKALREHVKELEAAMAVCLAKPTKKPVHKLRSSTRRIEALLDLLEHVPGLPTHAEEQRSLRRELRKLRRAAGAVRDLDVHDELLTEFLHPRSRSQEAHAVRQDAEAVHADQQKRREQVAGDLQDLIKQREADIAAALEALVKALKPAEGLRLPASHIVDTAQAQVQRTSRRLRLARKLQEHGEPKAAAAGKANGSASKNGKQKARPKAVPEDQLHSIRKQAKAARYMLEAAGPARRAAALAREYESLQESGGHWHDWLELGSEARKLLGRKHPLTEQIKDRRKRQHDAFVSALARHFDRHALA